MSRVKLGTAVYSRLHTNIVVDKRGKGEAAIVYVKNDNGTISLHVDTNRGIWDDTQNAWAWFLDPKLPGLRTPMQIISLVGEGVAPISVTSKTVCKNLNADLLNGKNAEDLVGEVLQAKNSGVTDIDEINEPGVFMIPSTMANLPLSGLRGLLVNFHYKITTGGGTIFQIYFPFGSVETLKANGLKVLSRIKVLESDYSTGWVEINTSSITKSMIYEQIVMNQQNTMGGGME